MSNTSFEFANAWILLLIIPAIILSLIPYFRLKKSRRRVRSKIVSLVLHSAIIVLIALTCADLKIVKKDDLKSSDTIILVDVSRSSVNSKQKVDNYIKNILEESDSKSRVGIVTFGNDCEYVSKLSNNYQNVYENYINSRLQVKDDATNIEQAINYVQDILKDRGGRIVVLTDGLETDGNALLKASEISGDLYQIDTLIFDNEPIENEVQISRIDKPENVLLNETTTFAVILESSTNTVVNVKFKINDFNLETKQVFLSEQETSVEFTYTFTETKEYTIVAEIECENDTNPENNIYYTNVNITLDNKILLIDGTGSESAKLENFLSDNGYLVDVINASNSMEVVLEDYKEVVLMNVAVNNLPLNFDTTIQSYVANGGNLLTTGGTNTYYNGGMSGTAFEDVLPITMEKDNMAPIGVMFVVDASGSMVQSTMPGSNKNRLEVAKDAVKESIKSMRNGDYAGVISFNTNPTVEIPMTPLTKQADILAAVDRIQNATGTYYRRALEETNRQMQSYDKTDIKHVIFMSDGTSNDTGYTTYVAGMFQKGITCSTIAIGNDLDASELERMANIGGGNFYKVSQASELQNIMVEETKSLQTSYINEGTIRPIIKSHTAVMRGITTLPNLGGYIGVTSKSQAMVVLQANNDALYVEWVYEQNHIKGGKVASFMSDLSGTWSSEYFTDERGTKFIKNIIDNLLTTSVTRNELSIQFNRKNFQNILVVNTPSLGESGNIKAKITYPDKTTKTVDVPQTAASVYSSLIPDFGSQAGIYKIEVSKIIGAKVTTEVSYVSFSYSEEFNFFKDTKDCVDFAQKLASNGKGKLYTLNDDILNDEVIYDEYVIDPTPTMMIMALILFLLDIIVRKFNFKWPHEWFRKKEAKE